MRFPSVSTREAAQNIATVSAAATESGEISTAFRDDAKSLAEDAANLQETMNRLQATG